MYFQIIKKVSLPFYFLSIVILVTVLISSCNKAPVSSFTALPAKVKLGQQVTFTDASTGANRYLWDFGDGITRNDGKEQKYAYSLPGSYTPSQTVWNKKEKKEETTTQNVTVEAPTKDELIGTWYYYFVQDVTQWETFTDKSTALNETRVNQVYYFDRQDYFAGDVDTFSLNINNYGTNILYWLWDLNGGNLLLKDTSKTPDVVYTYNIVKLYNGEMILRDKKAGFDRLMYFKQ